MKKNIAGYLKSLLMTTCILLMVKSNAQQTAGSSITSTDEWYKKADWLNGLALHPHASTDQQVFALQYKTNKSWWDKAFSFLKNNRLDTLSAGHYAIDGNDVFADITETPSTPLEEAKWHSHKRYCDIQYVIRGKENTGVAPIKGAPIETPFNDKGDSQFYISSLKGKYYLSDPASFFIFFPSDVHRPFIKVEGAGPVKRIRIKIRSV